MKSAILLHLLLFACSVQASAQLVWAGFRGGAQRDGVYQGADMPYFGELHWKFKTGGKIFSSPVVWENVAYVGSEDGYMYALDTDTGQLKWRFETAAAIHSSPAYFKNRLYFSSFDGNFYALDASTGKELWRFSTGGESFMGGLGYWGMEPADQYLADPWDFFLSSPVLDPDLQNPLLYFGSSDGHVYALDAGSGKLQWKFKTGNMVHASPAIYQGKLYVGSWDGIFYALDAATGRELWKFSTGDQPGMSGIQASPAIADGKVYFGARDAHVYALDAQTGALLWKYFADNSWIISSAAVQHGTLYVGTSDSYLLLALDAETGREKWRFKARGYVYSSPALQGNTAYFGDFTGSLYALELSSQGKIQDQFQTENRKKAGPLLLTANGDMDFMQLAGGTDLKQYAANTAVMDKLYSLGPFLASPVPARGVLFAASADGYLYAIKLRETPSEIPQKKQ